MAKRKTLTELYELKKRLEERVEKNRQKLKLLNQRLKKEYRKREASFLIGIGRTLLKHGKEIRVMGEGRVIGIPLNDERITELFTKYRDVVELSEDFKKWKERITVSEEKG